VKRATTGEPNLFFILSKTLGVLLLPANLMVGAGLIGAVLLATRFVALGRKLLVASVVLLAILGYSPLGIWLLYPLEARFPAWDPARGAPDGVVVLGGAIDPDLSAAHDIPVMGGSMDRVIAAAGLARRYPNLRILYSGGNPNLIADDAAKEADYVAAVFATFGISRDRVLLERRARNTLENAEFARAMISPRPGERWLLITSAFHMPRSVGVFRKAGFPIEPYPVDWRIIGRSELFRFSISVLEGLGRFDTSVREWIGLAAYWATGKTSEFFPGPDQIR
jgi:uncharacterized SAM-binding protein YcdF (DUF218 family)